MIKLVIIAVFLAAAYSNDDPGIKCYAKAAAGDDLEEKECDTGVTTCAKPIFTILGGIAEYDYGCGPCAGENSANCETCATEKCNAKLMAGEEFKCKNYAWDTDAYKAGETETTCKTLKDSKTENKCNTPAEDAKENEYIIANKGCGPCDTTDGNKCVAIDGAVGVSALLLPLLAAIYTLF